MREYFDCDPEFVEQDSLYYELYEVAKKIKKEGWWIKLDFNEEIDTKINRYVELGDLKESYSISIQFGSDNENNKDSISKNEFNKLLFQYKNAHLKTNEN